MKSRHQAALLIALIAVTFINLVPVLWAMLTSLKQPVDAFAIPPKLIFEPTLMFHYEVWVERGFATFLANSLFVSIITVLISVPIGAMAGYALARTRNRFRHSVLFGLLAVRMFPQILLAIPFFVMANTLGLIDTYWALILPAAFSAYGTFMLRQFFLGIPRELEEAATIDGCNALGIFRHVVLPLSKPALAALAILTFMGSWRSFMWPLIVCQSQSMFTLPVALSQFQGLYGVQWALLMAGSTIMLLPMLIVFIVGQRYFISGIQLGAVKG